MQKPTDQVPQPEFDLKKNIDYTIQEMLKENSNFYALNFFDIYTHSNGVS